MRTPAQIRKRQRLKEEAAKEVATGWKWTCALVFAAGFILGMVVGVFV